MVLKHVFLTGPPGVGKTTLIKKVVKCLEEINAFSVCGFYTEELRDNKSRIGFDCIGINGMRGPLARVDGYVDIAQRRNPKVGKYTVMLNDFETTITPLISSTSGLVVLDEIGKMELLSLKFKHQVSKLLKSETLVLFGTIPIFKNIPIVESIRVREDVKVIELTLENRNDEKMVDYIVKIITLSLESVSHRS